MHSLLGYLGPSAVACHAFSLNYWQSFRCRTVHFPIQTKTTAMARHASVCAAHGAMVVAAVPPPLPATRHGIRFWGGAVQPASSVQCRRWVGGVGFQLLLQQMLTSDVCACVCSCQPGLLCACGGASSVTSRRCSTWVMLCLRRAMQIADANTL